MSLKISMPCHDSCQEELKEHEKMREELLKTLEAETKALEQQHEDQVALLLSRLVSEKSQHQHEVRAFSRPEHETCEQNLCGNTALTLEGYAVRANAAGTRARLQQVQS
jgi:hypothetical protein